MMVPRLKERASSRFGLVMVPHDVACLGKERLRGLESSATKPDAHIAMAVNGDVWRLTTLLEEREVTMCVLIEHCIYEPLRRVVREFKTLARALYYRNSDDSDAVSRRGRRRQIHPVLACFLRG